MSTHTVKEKKSFFSKVGFSLPSMSLKNTKGAGPSGKTKQKPSLDSLAALEHISEKRCSGSSDVSFEIGALNTAVRPPRNSSAVFELIPNKLCLAIHPDQDFSRSEIKRRPELFFFSTDLHERYIPFCKDFGPVSCGIAFRFWQYVRSKEHHPNLRGRPLVYYTDLCPKNHANAAVLLGSYMMLEHKMCATDVVKAFKQVPGYPFVPFRDATFTSGDFGISLEDCLFGFERAIKVGWFSTDSFDADQFEELEDPEGGDVSLIGDKFVAFRGPRMEADGKDSWTCPPSFYFDLFKSLGVTTIVRLNEPGCYDKADFERQGLAVHDLEFPDCTCPPPALIKRFLDLVDAAPGRVAVHCKAGLGRTGTMIGLWMMKHKGFSAREAIAYMRLCRPGCVIGQQQHFLAACDNMAWDGNLPLPPAQEPASPSTAASGAATPVVVAKLANPSKKEVASKEALGKEIERASRNRALLRRAAH